MEAVGLLLQMATLSKFAELVFYWFNIVLLLSLYAHYDLWFPEEKLL